MATVVIAEDEALVSMTLATILTGLGHRVMLEVTSGIKAVEAVRRETPDLVFMDIAMQGNEDGIQACQAIKAMTTDVKVIFITGYPRDTFTHSLEGVAYDGYIAKPTRLDTIRACLEGLGF